MAAGDSGESRPEPSLGHSDLLLALRGLSGRRGHRCAFVEEALLMS